MNAVGGSRSLGLLESQKDFDCVAFRSACERCYPVGQREVGADQRGRVHKSCGEHTQRWGEGAAARSYEREFVDDPRNRTRATQIMSRGFEHECAARPDKACREGEAIRVSGAVYDEICPRLVCSGWVIEFSRELLQRGAAHGCRQELQPT